jgi:hypothetical protein
MLTSLNNEENQLIIFCPYCLTQVEESVKCVLLVVKMRLVMLLWE